MEILYAAGIGVLAIVGYWYVRKVQKHGSKDSTSRITQEIAAYTPIEEAEIAGLTELERLRQVPAQLPMLGLHWFW